MRAQRKQRLFAVIAIVLGVSTAVSLTVFALRQNINLFFSPSQISKGEAPFDRTIRIGGLVVPGSVERDPSSLRVAFTLTDNAAQIPVQFEGILPDLFREGQGIVARGTLHTEGYVVADEVLAKHDENYMPPEVAESLQQAGMPHSLKTE